MQRRTHLWHYVGLLIDPSYNNALKLIKSYRRHLQRTCQLKDYACVAYIGVFKSNAKDLVVSVDNWGKKTFIHSGKPSAPEIHIVLLANPGQTISKLTLSYFSKHCYKGNVYKCDKETGYVLSYVMEHSENHRTLMYNTDVLPKSDLTELVNVAECMNVTLAGKVPIFEGLSTNRFEETKTILSDAGVDVLSHFPCSYNERILRRAQLENLFNINFTTYPSHISIN